MNNGEKPFLPPPGPTPPPHAYGTWESKPSPSPPGQVPFSPYAPQGSPPPPGVYPNGARPPSTPGSPRPETVSSSTYAGYTPMQSPPMARTSPDRTLAMSVTSRGNSPPIALQQSSFADEGKLSVSIDFGTTFSGVAYGSSRIAAGKVQQILNWPGSFETFRKIPTCLLYDQTGQVIAWGIEAKNAGPVPGAVKCEWFKLFLEPHALRDETNVDPRLPALPPGKRAIDLIIDFLSCLWDYAKQQITREIGAVADLDSADVWLTVPAAWDATGCQMMRDAAIAAGLVRSARAGDHEWRDRLRIISEPEAAAVHCANLTDVHKLSPNQNFMICDAGGGTVDLAVYRIIGMLSNLEIAELCARSGANCGSLFLDLRFRELMKTLLADHPVHLDRVSLANFMESFSETDKLRYMGEEDDDKMFHFTCFNVEDPDDPAVGLVNGEVAIPGNLLRREVFDPVVDEVLELIEAQTQKVNRRLDALLLVGGFSASEYLFRKVQEQFKSRIRVIARPADCDTATVRGAAQYGLARRPLVSSVIAPQSYMLKVKLPAENEDWLKRPAYIRENDAGVAICESRLQYLVAKGAIMRKGQRLKTTFCKFSQTPNDRMFVATLYTSDSDKIMRYTDEGEINELCKWTIDLGALPSFQQNASVPNSNGFYTEFELGLELDSAEVRGVLIYQGQDWGRVVFDYRS
ncbi:actin-like ATPase domain-containing protein [Trametes versicolor FP-101664 SS1]|uniref:actin-like ATPase domain-containing protein n=1 Tax=Trametes versicolor (strain FP-101664) TaxID=717944 RepID=UPI0004621E14|nr:actin-like ATPase domain-containing protein [Trametes versicolor FP-101664 SS1]EIW56662.1 actin-like ATPase domain-containing protein [Trametes versicolor FP-101664 SS1]